MSKKKYVSISAILRCSQVSATTTFEKKGKILKINNIEIATENNIQIKPFSEDCQKGGCLSFGAGGKPCTPKLKKWKNVATKRKINGKHPLLEDSETECETIPGSKVVIQDPKQNTVFYDFEALMVLEALDKLNEMLAFRLNQYKIDPDKFNACFDKYFGEGHSQEDKEKIIERMKRTQNLLSNFKNKDGSLNEDYFRYESMNPNTYAYVISGDSNHVVHLNSVRFDNGNFTLGGFDSLPGSIAHEISHFKDIGNTNETTSDGSIGGTIDYHCEDNEGNKLYNSRGKPIKAYQSRAIDLVDSNIQAALVNADNFEYFLESGEKCSTYTN